MKRFALLLAICACIPGVARADDASRHAKAEELMALLHVERLTTQMMEGVRKQVGAMSRQMAGGNISPADQAKIDDFQKRIIDLVDSKAGWKVMKPEYSDLYAKTFTDEELDGILTFYRSPVGTSLIEKLPAITAQAMQLSQARLVALQPQLKQLMDDFAKSVAPTGTTPPPGPPR